MAPRRETPRSESARDAFWQNKPGVTYLFKREREVITRGLEHACLRDEHPRSVAKGIAMTDEKSDGLSVKCAQVR